MRNLVPLLGLVAFLIFLPLFSVEAKKGYEEIPVSESGSIGGLVTFSGKVPPTKIVSLRKFPHSEFCSQAFSGMMDRILQEVRVGDGGGLGDAVVYIEDIRTGKPFNFSGAQVNSKDCEFIVQGGPSKMTGVVVNDGEIRFLNEDSDPSNVDTISGVPHNPEGHEIRGKRNKIIFKANLLEKGEIIRRQVKLKKKNSYLFVECGVHNFMRSFFLPVKNPYYSIVGEDGQFSIDEIPPGKYKVIVWHPKLGRIVKSKVQVLANEATALDFTYQD